MKNILSDSKVPFYHEITEVERKVQRVSYLLFEAAFTSRRRTCRHVEF